MLKSKSAIGPVVASALLLVVAVVAVVGFQTWFSTYSSDTFTKVEIQSSTGNLNTKIDSLVGSDLYFSNGQNENITISQVKVEGVNCNISGNYSQGINKLDLRSCINEGSSIAPEIVVYTNNGIFSKRIYMKNPVSIVYYSCTLDNITISHLENYTFYDSSLVGFGNSCSSILRVCNDGTYDGNTSFIYSSCSVQNQDINPNYFNFTNQTSVESSILIYSDILIPSGFDGPLSVGITGNGTPKLSVNGGGYVTSTTMYPGDTLRLMLNSSSNYNTTSIATLTLGNFSTLWSVKTKVQVKTTYYSPGNYNYVVPTGVNSVSVKMWGAAGGAAQGQTSGAGGYASAEIPVTPSETLNVYVGSGGGAGCCGVGGGGGGGLTGIFRSTVNQAGTLLIAGGGGGAGTFGTGGAGGDNISAQAGTGSYAGGGATSSGGGTGANGAYGTDGITGGALTGGRAGDSVGSHVHGGVGGSINAGAGSGVQPGAYGGGGGGTGYWGGGGGYGESNTAAYGGGGGAGISYSKANNINSILIVGNRAIPGNDADVDRGTAGSGVTSGTGNSGAVIITYYIS